MNAIYPACCRPFWGEQPLPSFSPPQLRGMEIIRLAGYVYEEKLAIANQYLIPQTIATWWAIFRNCFFFRRDIFAGWQRIKWFSERGWWVCLVSRTSILMDTWSHTHSFHIVINYPIYIYIYIYTLYNKVALVVSDLLQDEKTSWYVIFVDFFQANNGVAKDMLDLQPEVVCRHGCHWWCLMFLESSMSLQRKPTISHECMCWGYRNSGKSGKILFIAILIFCK